MISQRQHLNSAELVKNFNISLPHRKVTDPKRVLQQFLKWHGPAHDTVGWAVLSGWSPRKAGAAAATAACGHVQI